MNIAICDNDITTLQYLDMLINTILNSNCNILKFNNGSKLKNYLNYNIKDIVDILIINTDLGIESGIEIAKNIRRNYSNLKIIFIAPLIEHAKNIFEVEPIYLLVKPIDMESLKKSLNIAIKSIEKDKPRLISLYKRGKVITINLRNVIYIESVKRQIIIHEFDNNTKVYYKLKDLETNLPNNFVRCHQSYIVNMDNIKLLDMNSFLLKTDIKIPISQSRYSKTKETFKNYFNSQNT